MIKKLLFFSIVCLSMANVCRSQEFVHLCRKYIYATKDISGRIPQNDIDDLHALFKGMYHREPTSTHECEKIIDTFQIVEIFNVRLEDSISFDCEMFLDGTFLDNIVPVYGHREVYIQKKGLFKRWKKVKKAYVWAWTAEYDKQCDFRMSYLNYYNLNDKFELNDLMRIMKEYNIVSLYNLDDYHLRNLIGVTENRDIYFLRSYDGKIEVYSAKDFKDDRIPYMFNDENNNSKWNCNKDD